VAKCLVVGARAPTPNLSVYACVRSGVGEGGALA
jgi:hypothetical protein